MSVECENFRPRRTLTLRGFVTVLLPQTQLRIYDVALHDKDGSKWAQLPGRPMLDREGRPLRDQNGRVKYAPVMQFADRTAADQFSQQCIAAALRQHPRIFDDGGES
jgi:hypothetical protein